MDGLISDTEMEGIITDVINMFLIPHFISLGMNASGNWIQRIEARGSSIWGQKYTEQLVYGRGPGTFAPIAPLVEWAKIKLGLSGQQAVSAAYAINYTLKEEGSRYYREGGTDLLEILHSKPVIDFINTRVGNFIKQQIELDLIRQIRTLK